MSLIAKNNGTSIPPIDEGTYQAICTGIIDIGLQENDLYKKATAKTMVIWSFPTELIEVDGEKLPRVISKEYTCSLNEKSTLRRDLQAWRGKQFTEEELKGFALIDLLNIPCYMQITHKEKNGNKYPEISSIMALPKDIKKAECKVNNIVFDFDDRTTWDNYINISAWIQKKIKNANNYESSGLKEYVEKIEVNTTKDKKEEYKDDLPF